MISTVDLPVDYILAELVVCLKGVIPCFPKLKMTCSNVTFGPPTQKYFHCHRGGQKYLSFNKLESENLTFFHPLQLIF